jgi:hypothetical protein
MSINIHKGDVGTVLELTVVDEAGDVIPIDAALTKQIKLRKPPASGNPPIILTKAATFVTDGLDGKMQYTTIAGDMGFDGPWDIQGFISFGATDLFHTESKRFTVLPILE